MRRLITLVSDSFLEAERGVLEPHHALQQEGCLAAMHGASQRVAVALAVPGQRCNLPVEGDRMASIRAWIVDAREELLPPARVVPHELVVGAALERRRARRL